MTGSTDTGCSLGPIRCITCTAPDLDRVEACYTHYFDYEVVTRSFLTEEKAKLWHCPALANSASITLAPSAGTECVFRFIESPRAPDYVPFATHGWNAAEIMVQNVDAMAERLHGSDFDIIGEPANLSFSDDIRAMQVLGPGGELLYLTEFKKQLPGLDVPEARCPVDRVFIVILGGPSMAALQDFYAKTFNVPGAAPVESRVKGISAAFGNSPEHKYPIAALPLNGRTLIEVDEMPPQAAPRPSEDGKLPAGISIVSFSGGLIDRATLQTVDDPLAPYGTNSVVAVMRGAAGELIEVIHRI